MSFEEFKISGKNKEEMFFKMHQVRLSALIALSQDGLPFDRIIDMDMIAQGIAMTVINLIGMLSQVNNQEDLNKCQEMINSLKKQAQSELDLAISSFDIIIKKIVEKNNDSR